MSESREKFEKWFLDLMAAVPKKSQESDSGQVIHNAIKGFSHLAWIEQQKNIDHWKTVHQNMVDRARFLHERTDLPVERIRAWEEMGRLQAEVKRLRLAIKAEADYCQGWADQYKGEDRGLRHQERADRLMAYLERKE